MLGFFGSSSYYHLVTSDLESQSLLTNITMDFDDHGLFGAML